MNYKERYNEYLKSEEWADKRQQKAKEQHFTCEICGKVILKGFHIHHKTYIRFGCELMKDLQFLCEECHTNLHCHLKVARQKKKHPKKIINSCRNCYYSQIMRYKTSKPKNVLWCNLQCKECESDGKCRQYKKGAVKSIPQVPKKKPVKRKKMRLKK